MACMKLIFFFLIWPGPRKGAPVLLPSSFLFFLGHVLLIIPPGDWSDTRGLFNLCFSQLLSTECCSVVVFCVYIPIGAELRTGTGELNIYNG